MMVGTERIRDKRHETGQWTGDMLHAPVMRRAEERAYAKALIRLTADAVTAWTWRDIDAISTQLAMRLLDIGCKQDTRIGLIGGDTARFALSLIAVSKAGMIAVPLSPSSALRDLSDACDGASVGALIVLERPTADLSRELAAITPCIRFVLGFDAGSLDGIIPLTDQPTPHNGVAESQGADPASGDALAGIPPRFGNPADHAVTLTFADPGPIARAFVRTHNHWLSMAALTASRLELDTTSRMLCPFLATSPAAQFAALAPWVATGMTLVTSGPVSPSQLWRICEAVEITHCLAPERFLATDPTSEPSQPRDMVPGFHIITGRRSSAGEPRLLTNTLPCADATVTPIELLGAAGFVFRDAGPEAPLRFGYRPDTREDREDNTETKPSLDFELQIRGVADLVETLPKSGLLRGELTLSGPAAPATYCLVEGKLGTALRLVSDITLTRLRAGVVSLDPPGLEIVGRMDGSVDIAGLSLETLQDKASETDDDAGAYADLAVVPDPLLGHRLVSAPDHLLRDCRRVSLRDPAPDWVDAMLGNGPAIDVAAQLMTASAAHDEAQARSSMLPPDPPAGDSKPLSEQLASPSETAPITDTSEPDPAKTRAA
ncbi:MAG: class I adenylate-forming enzyme family protein [Pseudomonadota bacterium]